MFQVRDVSAISRALGASLILFTAACHDTVTLDVRSQGVAAGAPAAALVFPPPRSLTNATHIVVRGTAADVDGVAAIRVNGQTASSDDGYATWQIELDLAPGENAIVVESEDLLGNIDANAASAHVRAGVVPGELRSVAADPNRDRLLVLDRGDVLAVDPATGATTMFSAAAEDTVLPGSRALHDLAVDGDRIVALGGTSIIELDPATGARTEISANRTGSGPDFQMPRAITTAQGTMLVTDLLSLLRVSPITGRRVIVSSQHIGTGPAVFLGTDVIKDGTRALVANGNAIVSIDLASGNRGVFSSDRAGSGPSLIGLQGMTRDGGRILAVDLGHMSLTSIDLATGNRSILSRTQDGEPDIGSGPRMDLPMDVAVIDGAAVIVDPVRGSVMRIDPATGDRTALIDGSLGAGTPLGGIHVITGDLARPLLTDGGAIYALDPASSERALVSSHQRGTGPIDSLSDIAVSGAELWATDSLLGMLLRVDPLTGDRVEISGPNTGSGPALVAPGALAVSGDSVWVFDHALGTLVHVDAATGERAVLDDPAPGLALTDVRDLVVIGNRAVLTDMANEPGLVTIDLTTGERAMIADDATGADPAVYWPTQLAAQGTDAILVWATVPISYEQHLLRVDLATGDRTVITGNGTHPGPELYHPQALMADGDVALYSIPEQNALYAVDLTNGARVLVAR